MDKRAAHGDRGPQMSLLLVQTPVWSPPPLQLDSATRQALARDMSSMIQADVYCMLVALE